jgi:putative transposase
MPNVRRSSQSCLSHTPADALGASPTREILNAIFYVLCGGVAGRLVPSNPPPKSTVFRWFSVWRDTSLFETINHLLVTADRERVGRQASPTAAVLNIESVKTTKSGGPRGYDAGKKVNNRRRQVRVDTDGRGLILEPQLADVQDRDGAPVVLRVPVHRHRVCRQRLCRRDPSPRE